MKSTVFLYPTNEIAWINIYHATHMALDAHWVIGYQKYQSRLMNYLLYWITNNCLEQSSRPFRFNKQYFLESID